MKVTKPKASTTIVSMATSKFQPKPAIRPIYSSAGCKHKLLEFVKSTLPNLDEIKSYIEPFSSTAGAVFSDMVNNTTITDFRINDSNPERIHLFKIIQKYPTAFISECEKLAETWNSIKKHEDRKEWFYEKREEYQTMEMGRLNTAALFHVLERLAFSGIYRKHKVTQRFYGAVGHRNRDLKINSDQILEWSRQFNKTKISCGRYQDMVIPKKPSLIFCDPPYRQSQIGFGYKFGDKELIELIKWCEEMSRIGHTVLLTNLDDDDFIKSRISKSVVIHSTKVKFTAGRTKLSESTKKVSTMYCFVFKQTYSLAANDEQYDLPVQLSVK